MKTEIFGRPVWVWVLVGTIVAGIVTAGVVVSGPFMLVGTMEVPEQPQHNLSVLDANESMAVAVEHNGERTAGKFYYRDFGDDNFSEERDNRFFVNNASIETIHHDYSTFDETVTITYAPPPEKYYFTRTSSLVLGEEQLHNTSDQTYGTVNGTYYMKLQSDGEDPRYRSGNTTWKPIPQTFHDNAYGAVVTLENLDFENPQNVTHQGEPATKYTVSSPDTGMAFDEGYGTLRTKYITGASGTIIVDRDSTQVYFADATVTKHYDDSRAAIWFGPTVTEEIHIETTPDTDAPSEPEWVETAKNESSDG